MRILDALRRCRRGVAAIEAGLIGSAVLVPMGLGAVQFGLLVSVQSGLDTALQGALQQLWHDGTLVTSSVNTAANKSWGNRPQTLTVAAPTTTCYCLADTDTRGSSPAVACGTTCGSSTKLAKYVTLTVSSVVPLIVPLPMLASNNTLTATATVRLP